MRSLRVKADAKTHRDYMSSFNPGGIPVDFRVGDWVYLIEEKGARLVFVNLDQVRIAQDWFARKTHASTRRSVPPGEHFWQPWHARLPKQFTRRSARPRVLKALQQILSRYS
ncbi:MAG: hypothetical protein AAF767_10390 [Pseudomonadota bacterium]